MFVVGIWRSGTSLLYALLNQHPNIALFYEGDLPEFWPMFLLTRRKAAWLERWNLYNEAVTRHHIDTTKIPEELSDISVATEVVYKQYADLKGAGVWGCKSPSYYCSLPRLVRQFPDARFIVIWRDVHDTCGAILRAGEASSWFRKPGVIHRAILGYRRLRLDTQRLLARGVPVHQLHYEDLVQNPAEVMKGTCEFLGLDFDPKMLSLAGADRSAIYEADHHSKVKSGSISAIKRTVILPGRLDRKIRRYLALWRQQSGGTWPVYPLWSDVGIDKPSLFERVIDEALFCVFRCIDRLVVFAFCFAPVMFLRGYRGAKAAIMSVAVQSARRA